MKWVTKLSLVYCFLGILSCSRQHPRELRPVDYVRYVESGEGELASTIKSGPWSYRFQYKPADYIALRESDGQHVDPTFIAGRRKTLKKSVWFNMTIRVTGTEIDPLKYNVRNLDEYNSRLNYFLMRAAANLHLTYGAKGAMKQIGYQFENNFSIKPEVTTVVGFSIPDDAPVEPLTIEYDDGLFNAGILKFSIAATSFKAIPKLAI